MNTARDILATNLAAVEARIQAACVRAGRQRDSVTLIAVTKTVSADVAHLLLDLGVADLGESRPQELWRKAALLPATTRWHLIGHIQRNKIERTVPLVTAIHSVDSVRVLEALEATGVPMRVYLEFNCSGEASKQGFAAESRGELVPVLKRLTHLQVVGLMTMAAPLDDPEGCRPTFRQLSELAADLRVQVGGRHALDQLSMGMSNDFEVAIEEGATAVRLGSILFEGLPEETP